MANLSTAMVCALDLGEAFREHDERPQRAAQAFLDDLSVARLDELVAAMWIVIEHPSARAPEICEAWRIMCTLKSGRRYL
ncbi:hypothetical protein ILT44_04440 [Microvirga sp. BT689]|uniref:hypothetical protein n=1 Tax=Microvirga arvi TaxID=2778731 RepID=UPI001951CB2E|nr:hypothetical protein [Microvirga arvi]MBM6579423.1 hypothetical protein [Microvirga arvi]